MFDVLTAPAKSSKTWRQIDVGWDDVREWVRNPKHERECGGYVPGEYEGSRRLLSQLKTRTMLTLDVDNAEPGFLDELVATFPYRALVHTTWKSTPDAPRYRIIIPLARPLGPEEAKRAATTLADQIGREKVDDTCLDPNHFMFYPATQNLDEYEWAEIDRDTLDGHKLLGLNPDEPLPLPARTRKKGVDELEGTLGAFCRAHTVAEVIAEYELPYEPADGRWRYTRGQGAAGMDEIEPGIVFSHHNDDPAGGVACNVFDLVRLHRFADLDRDAAPDTPVNRLPSHDAMLQLAVQDQHTLDELNTELKRDFEALPADDVPHDDTGWQAAFVRNPRTGQPTTDVQNMDLLVARDAVLRSLSYNEMTLCVETDDPSLLTWRSHGNLDPTFSDFDRVGFRYAVERSYGLKLNREQTDDLISLAAFRRVVNPVRTWLESLEWDGVPRVETCLPGVKPTHYTRLVARKCITAAAARILSPGIKWDHSLILYGREGLGKTHWIEKMTRGYCDTLGPINNKDTLLAMQRTWVMVAEEGHAMTRADAEALKEFLTRRSDVFRLPYARETTAHLRHNVIWGTTNEEQFLIRQEGNRRYLIVECEEHVDFEALTPEYVDQVWAEAVYLFRNGEQLWLDEEASAVTAEAREQFTEEDTLSGRLDAYLELTVPPTWHSLSPDARHMWVNNPEGGTHVQDVVCTAQLVEDVFTAQDGPLTRGSRMRVARYMNDNEEWMSVGRVRFPRHGRQRAWARVGSSAAICAELGTMIDETELTHAIDD